MSLPEPAQKLSKTLDFRVKQAVGKYTLIQDDDSSALSALSRGLSVKFRFNNTQPGLIAVAQAFDANVAGR